MVIVALIAATVVVATPGPIEIDVVAVGKTDVPAQGYRVSVFFTAVTSASARDAAIASLSKLQSIKRPICASAAALGFMGNEQQGGPEEDEGIALGGFVPVGAVFATQAEAEMTQALLVKAGAKLVGSPSPVLFDCAAAKGVAEADAIKQSRARATRYAALVGKAKITMLRLADSNRGDLLAILGEQHGDDETLSPGGKVRVTATFTVTYRAE